MTNDPQYLGKVLVFTDRPDSMRRHIAVIRHYGLEIDIQQEAFGIAAYHIGNAIPHVALVLVDLDMSVDSWAEIGISPVDSVAKSYSGTAELTAQALFSVAKREISIAMLSSRSPSMEEAQKLDGFLRGHPSVAAFGKAGDFSDFEEFVRSAVKRDTLSTALAFSAIVRTEGKVADGSLIRLIEPAYLALVQALNQKPWLADSIDPRRWEEIVAASYERAGFDEVILTPRSGDLGRDIVAIKRGFGSVKFIEQVKAYRPGHLVNADEVRALLGVLHAEQDASKAVFTTTSYFAPRLRSDRLLAPFMPHRLELVDRDRLMERLTWSGQTRGGNSVGPPL